MALSNIEIINMALGYIKAGRITALDGSSEQARLAELYYNQSRDKVLEEHIWNVAIQRVQIAPLATKPAFGYANQFQLPNDPYCVRVVKVLDASMNEIKDYELESRRILCNESLVNLIYVGSVNDVSLYTPMMVECIARRLAADIAFTVTGTATVVQQQEQAYQMALSEARSLDASQGRKGESYVSNSLMISVL